MVKHPMALRTKVAIALAGAAWWRMGSGSQASRRRQADDAIDAVRAWDAEHLAAQPGPREVTVKPYTSADLIHIAIDIRGPQPIDPARVLATYADPQNWGSVHASDERGPRHYWTWKGPMIVGYELAEQGMDAAALAQVNQDAD